MPVFASQALGAGNLVRSPRALRPYKVPASGHTVTTVTVMDTDLAASSGTTTESPEDQVYLKAREQAEMIQGLYIHILVFSIINAGLFALNWVTRIDSGSWWFQWPLLVWGIGLVIHVLVTFAPVFSPDWTERRAEQIVSKGTADRT